jgi:hypothetical protein
MSFSFAGEFDAYVATIKSQCSEANQLVVKKSLIELTQEQNCNSAFTSLLLKGCSQLDCKKLISYWTAFNSATAGAVIGK